jgi:hypothetical protein
VTTTVIGLILSMASWVTTPPKQQAALLRPLEEGGWPSIRGSECAGSSAPGLRASKRSCSAISRACGPAPPVRRGGPAFAALAASLACNQGPVPRAVIDDDRGRPPGRQAQLAQLDL